MQTKLLLCSFTYRQSFSTTFWSVSYRPSAVIESRLYLSRRDKYDCAFSQHEKSKCIYEFCNVGT